MPAADPLVTRLRARTDWRLTAQRRVVAEAFEGEHVHLTAEEVFDRARERMPEISLATVYNTLNELVALGELQPLQSARGRPRYDPTPERHDHLVCLGCGAIHDVRARGTIELPPAQRFGHDVVAHETIFKGYCARCRSRARGDHAPTGGRRSSSSGSATRR